jgi:hypothetical protein
MPVIRPAQKHKYNTKTAQIHKTNTKQTNKQTNKQKGTILQEKICGSTGAKPLHSKETQISLF